MVERWKAERAIRRLRAAVSALVSAAVIRSAGLCLPWIGGLWPSGIDAVKSVDHVDARAARAVEDRAFAAAGGDGGPDGGENLGGGDGAVVIEMGGHARLDECSVGLLGGVGLRFKWACADGLADGECAVVEVDLEACVAVGLERGSGLGSEPRAGGAAGAADRIVEVVGQHAGGVAPGTLDGCGPLRGDHAGGGCERGRILAGGGQDVEDVTDEQLVDAFELAAQDLVAGEDLLEPAVNGGEGVAVGRVGPEGGDVEKAVLEGDLHAAAGDGFRRAAELVDDVAVVVLQQVDEGVAAGKEHVDVGTDPVLPASREDRTAAEVWGNVRAEHLGRYRANDAAFRGPQAGCRFGKRQVLHGLSGR